MTQAPIRKCRADAAPCFHEVEIIETYDAQTRKLRCIHCGTYFAMSDCYQAVLPWDDEYEHLVRLQEECGAGAQRDRRRRGAGRQKMILKAIIHVDEGPTPGFVHAQSKRKIQLGRYEVTATSWDHARTVLRTFGLTGYSRLSADSAESWTKDIGTRAAGLRRLGERD